MFRLALLYIFVGGMVFCAYRDWYKSLCGLILLVGVIEHPDMPKSMLGIQGMNPWNLALAAVVLAWLGCQWGRRVTWDMPGYLNLLLFLYAGVVIVGFFRMLGDRGGFVEYAKAVGGHAPSAATLWSENLINSLKWMIPGMLLYDGCRSRSRFVWGAVSLLGIYVLLSVQVIKWMPLGVIGGGEELAGRSAKILLNEVGYHRVNLSMLLAGASWAVFALTPLANRRWIKASIIAVSLAVLFSQALTGGRTGYATWAVVGAVLCSIRWRQYLALAPLAVLAIIWLVPGSAERMLQGFNSDSVDRNPLIEETMQQEEEGPHLYTVTAGRNIAWPYVIEKIGEAPIYGHGREAMIRTGISAMLWTRFRESFPHPHNAYFQLLMDNGWLGALPIFIFYALTVYFGFSLFHDSRSPIFVATGGIALSLVCALLAAGVGSQTFYPREGAVGMWCAMGLLFRVYVERSRIDAMFPKMRVENIDELLWSGVAG